MSDTSEIRRRKTADPELDAITVINQALAHLDRPAAKRVLDWADKRFVNLDEPLRGDQLEGVTKFMEAIEATAREMQISPPVKILDAMALVVTEMREQRKLEAVHE